MIYTIIAEPRSGGVSLMNWIGKSLPEFTIAQEPWFVKNDMWVKGDDVNDVEWIKKYDNIFIREIYKPTRDFKNLIDISDKVICLYRKNWEEQVRSILYQGNEDINLTYLESYEEEDVLKWVSDDKIKYWYVDYFKQHKDSFKEFIKNNKFTSLSYENLYYGNDINILKKHFNFDSEVQFPLNTRHLKRNGVPVEPENLKNNLI
jgi:hypothetical protein